MNWQYVIPGYVFVFAGIGLYTAWVLYRGRALSKRVPPEKRRFLD
jgi:hypothetical protein